MKIDILTHSEGSYAGVTCKTIYGEDGKMGVGGAELALLTMCETWHNNGHKVTLYNNPRVQNGSPFEQRPTGSFSPQAPRDVLIAFRTPVPSVWGARGLKVFWSCDQVTAGDYRQFAKAVDKIVTISPFHQRYFKQTYDIDSIPIDLPVRIDEYVGLGISRIHQRCIFTSVPDRGLPILRAVWPNIRLNHPNASLVITSDYRLWGVDAPMNEKHRAEWLGTMGVTFRGAINRRELVKEQLAAEYHLFPNIYPELFCIAVAESLVAGVLPITSNVGALETTNMGVVLPGNPIDKEWQKHYIELVNIYLSDKYTDETCRAHQNDAVMRFSPLRIMQQWNELIFSKG